MSGTGLHSYFSVERFRKVNGPIIDIRSPKEFKKEAFALFEGLLEKIKNDLIKFLLNLNIVVSNEERKEDKQTEILSDNKKVGRNEKCPCGSGKKYKHCCGSI